MKKTKFLTLVTVVSLVVGISLLADAQEEGRAPGRSAAAPAVTAVGPAIVRHEGTVIVPDSSIARPEDAGIRAHTNYKIFVPAGKTLGEINPNNTFAEYPSSLACLYGMGPAYAGCVPGIFPANNAVGGWGGIALVDAYDQPNMGADLKVFNSTFGLPAANFTKVYANSSFGTLAGLTASCSGKPLAGQGWDLEESLDVEWAHAMAPNAKIFLIEACSNSYNDLLFAEYVAGIKVSAAGGGDISNSWGSGEFSGETGSSTAADNFFYRYYWQNITYFASAGDNGWGAAYPSSSPWVVSAGGTTINRDASGNFVSESCWAGSGGGVSAYEVSANPPNNIYNGMGEWANFQYGIGGGYPFNSGARQTPDLAADADPASGVWVYDSYGGGWFVVGGTSVASPLLAGIVNNSQNRMGQVGPGFWYTPSENNFIYSELPGRKAMANNFYDVTTGSNGVSAVAGYDQCTGIGSPRNKGGK